MSTNYFKKFWLRASLALAFVLGFAAMPAASVGATGYNDNGNDWQHSEWCKTVTWSEESCYDYDHCNHWDWVNNWEGCRDNAYGHEHDEWGNDVYHEVNYNHHENYSHDGNYDHSSYGHEDHHDYSHDYDHDNYGYGGHKEYAYAHASYSHENNDWCESQDWKYDEWNNWE